MTASDLNPKNHPLNDVQDINLEQLASILTDLEHECGLPFTVNSGFRTLEEQERINPKNINSAHRTGEAVDIYDLGHPIYNWCVDNLSLIAELGLYIEDKSSTPRWIHLQIRMTRSGNIVFIP